MQYSTFTVLKVFIRTAKVFSLQFHSYHSYLIGISTYNLLDISQKGLKTKAERRENN